MIIEINMVTMFLIQFFMHYYREGISLVVMITIFSYTLYLAYKFVINNKILIKKVTISKKNIFIILALTYVIFWYKIIF